MQCHHCHNEINATAKFCKHCGQSVLEAKTEQPATEALTEHIEHNHNKHLNHNTEDNDELVQSESGTEPSFFVAPNASRTEQQQAESVPEAQPASEAQPVTEAKSVPEAQPASEAQPVTEAKSVPEAGPAAKSQSDTQTQSIVQEPSHTITEHEKKEEKEEIAELKMPKEEDPSKLEEDAPEPTTLVDEATPSSNIKLPYQLALIAALSSAVFVWVIGGLLSLITNQSLLTTLWNHITTNIIALPIEKVVLLEQHLKSSLWFIVNAFIGGQYSGTYIVNGEFISSFQLKMPIALALFIMTLIAWLHMKGIGFVLTKRNHSIHIAQKALITMAYFIATWLLIIIPLLILSPKLQIPFIEAPEQLKLRVSLLPSLLNSVLLFATSAMLAWLPWKKWNNTRNVLVIVIIFTSLLALSELFINLWRKGSFELQQLAGLHHSGIDLLWLNRFIAELFMSFGGRVDDSQSFFITMLHLPSTFTWQYSLVIVFGIGLIVIFQSLKATWMELISIAAIGSWFIYVINQFITIRITQQIGHAEMMGEYSSVYQLGLISGIVIPICILVLLLGFAKCIAPLFKTKIASWNKGWLNHLVKRKRLYAGIFLLLMISSLTAIQIISEDRKGKNERSQSSQHEQQWARQIVLLQQAPPQYALMQANELWAEQGTTESKALLAMAYLQAYQPNRAYVLLNESLLTSNKLFTKEQLTELMEASNVDDPLSVIHRGVEVASVSHDEVEYLLHDALESHVMPMVNDTLSDVVADVLPKLVGEATETIQQNMQLEPQYIDFMKALMPDMVDQLQKAYVDASARLDEQIHVQQAIADELRSAQAHSNADEQEQELTTVNQKIVEQWQNYVEQEEEQLLSLAKAAIYYGDTSRAESWLSLLNSYGSKQEEAVVLLASLYLNGERPGSHALQSTAYEQALHETTQLLKEKYEVILKDFEVTTSQQLAEKISNSYVDPHLQTQLAYTLLLPYEEDASTDVLYQLAKYHFQAGQIEEANKKIEELQEKVDELEVKQQYLIQKLHELPNETSAMTIEQMEQKHELTEQLYVNLEPTKGIAFSEQPLSSEQQAFSVYLSNQLLSFKKSSAQITSVQYDNGNVTLYARSENAEITSKGLKIFDNGNEITDYKLVKLSETTSFDRFVMLILDHSGSMQGQKIEVATQSAAEFVYALQHKETVGLVPFNDRSSIAVPFTKNYTAMERALASLSADGGTDIAPALLLGVSQLEQASGERIAFIISDGEDPNFSDPAVRQQIIRQANGAGITIYAVGFDAGYQTLRDVAEGTGGQYISATDFESLSRSFDTIRETLSRTYQISYKVNADDYGLHTVNLEQDEYADSKTYTIEDPNAVYFPADDGSDGFSVEQPKPKADTFSVTSYTPRKIVASKTGSTTITIEGMKLNEVEKVTFNDKEIDFKLVNDSKLTVSLSNKQSIGTHKLTLTTKQRQHETLSITYSNSAAQQSVKFGYATLYGDFIETKSGHVKLVGDVSVDKFIYPTSDSMVLKNDEELTFTGVNVNMNNTTLRLRPFSSQFSMTASNFGKTFSLSSQGKYAQAVSSLPGLDRFGIELKLAPVLTYSADMKTDDGTLHIRGGLTNFYKLYMLNDNIGKLKVKNTPIKWLPSDASAAIDYTKTGYTLSGTASVSLFMQGMSFDGVTLNIAYQNPDKRLLLKGQVTGMKLFKMETPRKNSTRITLEVGLHHANGLDRIGGELASNLSVPLGTSGLGLYKFGFLADWSAKNAGSVTLGIDTVIDTSYTRFVKSIEKIPVVNKIFDFDPAMCILCVDGTVGFTEIATTNWGLHGKLTAEMIGFKVAEVTAKVNKNEFELQTMKNKLIYHMDTNANIVFSDSNFRNHTTLKYRAMIDAVGFNPHTFTVVYVPAKFDYSYAELTKEKKGKTVKIQRIGNQLNIIR